MTNLREFALARLDPAGHLVEERRVSLVPAEADLDAARLAVAATASRDLAVLLESGCHVRGSETRPTVVAHLCLPRPEHA